MKKRILICTLILTLLLSVLASCGGAKGTDARDDMMEIANGAMTAAPEEMEVVYDSKYGYTEYLGNSKGYDTITIESGTTGANNGDYSEKIIKNVSISAQTKEYEKSLDGILSTLNQYGGYEESVTSSGKSYYSNDFYTRTARMTLRIPSENLDKFLGEIGSMINVTSQSSNKSNVTSQYYDLKARIEVLESERTAYEEMLKMAKDVTEVLEIKDRLYKTIEEIEANKTQINVYDNKVSFSTVHITLDEVREYVEVPTPKTSFGDRIAGAFKDSWVGFANGFQNFVVWFVSAIPTILVLAVIIGGGITIGIVIYKKAKKNDGE